MWLFLTQHIAGDVQTQSFFVVMVMNGLLNISVTIPPAGNVKVSGEGRSEDKAMAHLISQAMQSQDSQL